MFYFSFNLQRLIFLPEPKVFMFDRSLIYQEAKYLYVNKKYMCVCVCVNGKREYILRDVI